MEPKFKVQCFQYNEYTWFIYTETVIFGPLPFKFPTKNRPQKLFIGSKDLSSNFRGSLWGHYLAFWFISAVIGILNPSAQKRPKSSYSEIHHQNPPPTNSSSSLFYWRNTHDRFRLKKIGDNILVILRRWQIEDVDGRITLIMTLWWHHWWCFFLCKRSVKNISNR